MPSELPAAGVHIQADSALGTIVHNGTAVRILSPITGEVLESRVNDRQWQVRVIPGGGERQFENLLRGVEAETWRMREMERLQMSISRETGSATLADGGELVDDIGSALRGVERTRVLGEFFLDL
jgi:hypothetical protein